MKKSLGIGALSIAVLAAGVGWAAAQAPGNAPVSHGQGRGQRLADYLGLSDEQRATWKSLQEQHKTEMAPLMQEGRDLRDRLNTATNAANPDPNAVGQATLAMKQHREKIKASQEAFETRLTATLTDDQRTKFDAFKAANHGGRGRGFRGHGAPQPTEG
jgi:Spy/CpxP family protein refolding chaperone